MEPALIADMRTPIVCFLLCVAGCGSTADLDCGETDECVGNQPLQITDDQRGCTTDDDCTSAYQGETCDACACPNAAIAKSDAAAYREELASKRAAACAEDLDAQCVADCSNVRVVCTAGSCEVPK